MALSCCLGCRSSTKLDRACGQQAWLSHSNVTASQAIFSKTRAALSKPLSDGDRLSFTDPVVTCHRTKWQLQLLLVSSSHPEPSVPTQNVPFSPGTIHSLSWCVCVQLRVTLLEVAGQTAHQWPPRPS
jgi:hypothetical protein